MLESRVGGRRAVWKFERTAEGRLGGETAEGRLHGREEEEAG